MKYITIAALIVISTTLTLDEAPAYHEDGTRELNTVCYQGRKRPTLWERRDFIWGLKNRYCGTRTKTPFTIKQCEHLKPCLQWIRDNCGGDFEFGDGPCDEPMTEEAKRWNKILEERGYGIE